jgi:hypothetical protein
MTPDELRDACRNAHPVDARLMLQAADEIERLRETLELIAYYGGTTTDDGFACGGLWCGEQARRALEETK